MESEGNVRHDMAWHGKENHGMEKKGMACHGKARYCMESIDDFRGEISPMGEIKGPLIFYWTNFLY